MSNDCDPEERPQSEETPSESKDQDFRPLWGEAFVETYLETGNTMSIDNATLHIATMLVLTSRMLRGTHLQAKNQALPPMIHAICIQKSGTGKKPAFKFARMVAEMSNISFRSQTDLTSAGLIGSVKDGEPIHGVAAKADIVAFEEMSILFRVANREHSSNIGEHLNQIMDNNRVQRDLAHGTVSYQPKCSIFGTTYPPEDLDLKRLLNNGTLARFLFFFKEIDRRFYAETLRQVTNSIIASDGTHESEVPELVNAVGRLGKTLRVIRDGYESGFVFTFDFDPEEFDLKERMWDIYEEYPEVTKEVVEPAIIRYGIHALRIGAIMAALDRCSKTVTLTHMEQAMELFEPSWRQMLEYYNENYASGETPQNLKSETPFKILRALLKESPQSQSELAESIDVSARTIRKHTGLLIEEGLIEEEGGNGTPKTYEIKR